MQTNSGATARRNQALRTSIILLILFFAAWVPRVLSLDSFVTADERKWLVRSANFAYALAHGDLYHTYQREHPAVTNTWLGAAGVVTAMPEYTATSPGYFPADVEEFEAWMKANTKITPLAMLAWGRFWTVLAVAIVLTLAYFPLRRLFGVLAAVTGCLFVAWSPMAVAFSRQVQPDGLHAVFMYAALLYFLSWLYGGERKRDIFAAGILMGLGWLTKTPVIFLVPLGALLIALEVWRRRRAPEPDRRAWRGLLGGYVLWGVIATAVFFLLWPALWVDPIGIFTKMAKEMTVYIEGHINPNYFMGQVTQDPGPWFYPIAYYFRTTPAVLLGFVLGIIAAVKRWPPLGERRGRWAALALLIFSISFGMFMTLPAKKFDRYLLPSFLALDILGSLGWSALALWAARRFGARGTGGSPWRAWLAAGLVLAIGLIPLHGIFTAEHYPYYMTYFNPLAGGSATARKVMFVGWGEGMEQAGKWLNEQPDAADHRVVAWYAGGPLSYYFAGQSIGVISGSRMPWLDVDYVVTYINQIQRQIPTKAATDFFISQTPVYTATFQGLDLAKVYDIRAIVAQMYANAPKPAAIPAQVAWPDFSLEGLRSLATTQAGTVLPVEADWSGKLDGLKVSVRLIHDDGTLVAQQDVPLAPTTQLTLFVPPDAAPGTYGLYMLVYTEETMDPVATTDGQEQVRVATVQR